MGQITHLESKEESWREQKQFSFATGSG